MQLWIDNTGLQSAGLCLEGRASRARDYDVLGLLQLATLVIYSNKVSLNGFEEDIIANRSHEFVDKLQKVGIAEGILSINSVNKSEYARACKRAADSIAPNLCDSFNPDEFQLIGGQPPDLPRRFQERQVNYIALAKEQEGSSKLQEVKESALKDKAVGAVEYMMACSPALREAVARILTMYPDWEDRNSHELNVFLRYHLNDALAQQSASNYAPAIARAELVTRRNQYVIKTLEETMVDKTVADLRSERLGIPKYVIEELGEIVHNTVTELGGKPLGIPSTLAALLERSKGEPQAIFKVAREFREHSKQLRDALQTLTATYPDDTSDSRSQIKKQIKEYGQQLRRNVGLENATTPWDAIGNVRVIMGIPFPGKEFSKWKYERKLSKMTAVLTELVNASACSYFSTKFYEKLRKRSTEKTR